MCEITGNALYVTVMRAAGDSAYDLAVAQGFEGTLSEWLASLKGDKGDPGAVGPTGAAGATGAVGPQGEKGDVGNTLFAAFEVDIATGLLRMTTPEGFAGVDFCLNEAGMLEVRVGA